MKFWCSILLFMLLGELNAQNGSPMPAGARGLAMANASVTFQDINSIFSNQAGLAYLTEFSATVYGERRFELASLNQLGAAVAYPSKLGTFGLQLGYFGFDLYNEQKIGLAYSRKLMDKLSLGVQFDFLNTQIKEYGNQGVFTFEVGLLSPITKQISLAFHLYSPMRVELVDQEYIPTALKFGVSYKPSSKVLLTAELEKEGSRKPVVKGGLEYLIHPSLALRLGASTNPTLFSFGVGYQIKNQVQIDIASTYHQVLGFSPGVSIRFAFAKK